MEKKKMITLEVSEELNEALRVAAFNQKVTKSAFIRQVLESVLKKELKEVKND